MILEVTFHHFENESINCDCVIYSDVPNLFQFLVPTGLASSRDTRIHYVVSNQQPCLQPFNCPSQNSQLTVFVIGYCCSSSLQNGNTGFNYHKATVHLAALNVILQHVLDPFGFLWGQIVASGQFRRYLINKHFANFKKRSLGVFAVVVSGVGNRGWRSFGAICRGEAGLFVEFLFVKGCRCETSCGEGACRDEAGGGSGHRAVRHTSVGNNATASSNDTQNKRSCLLWED
mmetsp:Transcript_37905/g.77348  ORF Transcript_37905/g.77348 Transcript_37905/m.77348 type:complete len:231 (+) Transcript_37905:793-1485(+)